MEPNKEEEGEGEAEKGKGENTAEDEDNDKVGPWYSNPGTGTVESEAVVGIVKYLKG